MGSLEENNEHLKILEFNEDHIFLDDKTVILDFEHSRPLTWRPVSTNETGTSEFYHTILETRRTF